MLALSFSLSVSVALNIATAAPNTPLVNPLPSAATTDIALASNVCWSDDGVLCASEKVAAGDKLLTWSSVLSAAEAYQDVDVGLPLRRLAERCGPGFESVALAGLLGAEHLRGYKTRKPSALLEGGGADAFTDLVMSRWHELTRAIWADEASNDPIDPEMQPLVDIGVELLLPVLEARPA